jgi:hypothetical protein
MDKYLNRHLLRSPDADPPAGEGTPATPDVKTLQAELDQLKAQAATLKTQAEQAQSIKAATKAMFDPNKTVQERAAAAKQTLTGAGFSASEVDQWVAQNMAEPPAQEPPQGGERGQKDAGQQALEVALDTQRQQTNQYFNQQLGQAQTNQKFREIKSVIEKVKGPEAAARVVEQMKARLTAEAMTQLRSLHGQGIKLTPALIDAKLDAAVSAIATEYSAVIADASPVGRGAETGTSGTGGKLKFKDAPKLDLDKGDLAANHSQIEEWFTHEFQVMAQEEEASSNARRGQSKA